MKKTKKTVSMIRVLKCQETCMSHWARLEAAAQTVLCDGGPQSYADAVLKIADGWMHAWEILDGIQFGDTAALVIDVPAWENRPTYPIVEDC